jgi:hypothetical protein
MQHKDWPRRILATRIDSDGKVLDRPALVLGESRLPGSP